ncbi:hypothetical protein Tco_0147191, partial [Tanacetum coccineum]
NVLQSADEDSNIFETEATTATTKNYSNAQSTNLQGDDIGLHSTTPVNSGIPNVLNTRPILYIKVVNNEPVMNEVLMFYANKRSPTFLTKVNLQKLEANVPNKDDYDIWLPLASVYDVND